MDASSHAKLSPVGTGSACQRESPSKTLAYCSVTISALTSPASQRAFQLEREPLPVRESYGRNIYGQSVLLARRLIEAGTRVACVSWAPDANATWDTHGGNFKKLKGTLLPQFDSACGTLLTDLAQRGLPGACSINSRRVAATVVIGSQNDNFIRQNGFGKDLAGNGT